MASEQDLNIRIRILAEQQGVKLTEDAIQKVRDRTEELAEASDKAAAATGGVTDEMKAQAQAALKQINADEELAEAQKKVGHEAGSVREAIRGLTEVFHGLENGNPIAIFKGLHDIVKGLGLGVAQVAQAFIAMLPAILAIAAPVLAAIGAMKLAANDAEAAMKSWWASAAASAEAYKKKSEEVRVAAEADLAAQLAAVEKLKAGYVTLIATMEEAEKRAKAVTAAEKEYALALAKTSEEKAAIELKYGNADSENTVRNADLKAKNMADAASQARENIRGAETGVNNAQIDFDSAVESTRAFDPDDPRGDEDRKKALIARQKLDAAKSNLDKVTAANNDIISQADKAAKDAQLAKDVAAITKKTAAVNATKIVNTSVANNTAKEADLRATAQSAMESGDFAKQDAAVAELQKMAKAAADLKKSLATQATAVTQSLDAASKQADKNAVQIIAVTQGGTGGGG